MHVRIVIFVKVPKARAFNRHPVPRRGASGNLRSVHTHTRRNPRVSAACNSIQSSRNSGGTIRSNVREALVSISSEF